MSLIHIAKCIDLIFSIYHGMFCVISRTLNPFQFEVLKAIKRGRSSRRGRGGGVILMQGCVDIVNEKKKAFYRMLCLCNAYSSSVLEFTVYLKGATTY